MLGVLFGGGLEKVGDAPGGLRTVAGVVGKVQVVDERVKAACVVAAGEARATQRVVGGGKNLRDAVAIERGACAGQHQVGEGRAERDVQGKRRSLLGQGAAAGGGGIQCVRRGRRRG